MSLGGGHIFWILILLIIVLIIWGPGKLPDIGAGLGRAIREFRKASQEPQTPAPPPSSESSGDATTDK